MSDLVDWARRLASRYVAVEFAHSRWRHVQAVAEQAALLSPICGKDADLLIATAWVHDIGYSSELVDSGFHPVDGARFLAHLDADPRMVALVARHSAAISEARLRGLDAEYVVWPDEQSTVRDALWCADMTTDQTGQSVTFAERLDDITERYGAQHSVTCAISGASDDINRAIASTLRLAEAHRIDLRTLAYA